MALALFALDKAQEEEREILCQATLIYTRMRGGFHRPASLERLGAPSLFTEDCCQAPDIPTPYALGE